MRKLILRTPLICSDLRSSENIYLKPENLQAFGSYKIRGVVSAIETADPKVLQKGLFAASAGNMAQAVAFAAQLLKVPCHIYVPTTAPEVKKNAIRALNAELIELSFEEIWQMVRNPPKVDGLFFHPVLTKGLQEGYGEIANEILKDLPSVQAVVVPFGVGGLSLGLAKQLKNRKPDVKIYCCEPETAAPLAESLSKGYAVSVDRQPSFVDAIGTPEVLPFVFDEISKFIEGSLVVSIADTEKALVQLATRSKLVCEGAAGVAFAAAKQLRTEGMANNIVTILSGGNISTEYFKN